jgi:group I intron endonuclease
MEKVYIYSLSCPKTSKIRYVGKTNDVDVRLYHHINKSLKKGKKTHNQCWINSLVKESHLPQLEILDVVPKDEWRFWEMYWISQVKQWGYDLTNSTEGGDGVDSNKGRVLSDEHKQKISDGIKQAHKDNPSYNLTSKHSKSKISLDRDELYQKYIVENLSQPKCAEYFKVSGKVIFTNLQEYEIKKDKSVWQKQLSNKKETKAILQYDLEGNFIREFESLTEVGTVLDTNTSTIRACLCNFQKTAKGFKWEYKVEQ